MSRLHWEQLSKKSGATISNRPSSAADLAALCTRVDALEKEYAELLKDYTEVSPKAKAHQAEIAKYLQDIRVAYPLAIERKQSDRRYLLDVEGMRPDSQIVKGLEAEIAELTKRYSHYSRSTGERLSGHFGFGNSAGERMVLTLKGIEYAFRWCPPGKFMMGSPTGEQGYFDNETQHQVTLTKGFWMLETQVTQGMWESVMGSNPSHFKGGGKSFPVENVSWNDCQSFITKLNALLRDSTLQASNVSWGVSLPTEAQWEYACRAGTTGPYGGTGVLDAMGWYSGNSSSTTHVVGLKNPNAWGLFDMLGNVWEWCLDWYGDYPSGSVIDPVGASSGTGRVRRGGSWSSYAWYCRSAFRSNGLPDDRSDFLGFRPCLFSLVP